MQPRKPQQIDFKKLSVSPVAQLNTKLEEETIYSYGNDNNNLVLHTKGQDLMMSSLSENGFSTITARGVFDKPHGIKCVSQNMAKDIWVGNGGGELHYFKFPSRKIDILLPNFEMRAVVPLDPENYMVCTEKNGWFIFNEKTKAVKPYEIFLDNTKTFPNSTRNILVENDTLWFHESGISNVNRENKKITRNRHYPVLCFEPLNKDIIIYGTKGYHLMSFNKRTMKHDSLIKTDSMAIYDLAIKDNDIIGATDKGVLHYNIATKQKDVFADESILGDKHLLMVDYQEPYGFVFGSRDGTISTYNENTQKYSILYKDELEAGIAKIVYDNDNWWINTFNGLVSYNVKTKKLQRFSTKDGLSHNEGNRYSGIKTENGILTGSIKGLNYFNPDHLKPEATKSQLQLLKSSKYDRDSKKIKAEYNREILNKNEVITLPAEQKELEIYFALTNNVNQNENSYKYRLNKNDWVELGKEQTIRFINLASGSYDLEIEAQNFTGNKIGDSLKLQIDSIDFFYKTWWFYFSLLIAVVSLLSYLLYLAKKRQEMQVKFSRDLMSSQEEERNRIAKELHDSVGQQLTMIKRKSQNQKQEELTALTNTVLEEVRSISRGLYPANLTLLGLTESIQQLANDIDEQTDVFFSVELENIDSFFNQEATLHIFRFVQEALSNIIKHAEAKEVFISISKKNTAILLEREDNGKGFIFDIQQLKNSLGLKTLAERIKLVRGLLTITSSPGKGTKLTSEIPIKQ